MDSEIQNLIKTHKIKASKKEYHIYLNKPEDLVYDIDNIVIKIDIETAKRTVECKNIPESLKTKMESISAESTTEYIRILEENLNGILGGTFTFKKEVLKSEDKYAFPINNKVTGNLTYKAFKKNILLLSASIVFATVECTKCGGVQAVHSASVCSNCREKIELVFVPLVDPDFLGFLSFKRCRLLLINCFKLYFSCEECDEIYSAELPVGRRHTVDCGKCGKTITLLIEEAEYIEKAKGCKLLQGTPLPNNGTCEHYKKSQRWLRFPCCNGLYPCDICHDKNTNHKHTMANKMVCGLCSKEQGINTHCSCGMNLKDKSSQFWEGGKGNRDRATMSRKDSKKYRRS